MCYFIIYEETIYIFLINITIPYGWGFNGQEKIRILSERKGVRIPSLYVTELALPGSFVIWGVMIGSFIF
jgi:hypothetical protein